MGRRRPKSQRRADRQPGATSQQAPEPIEFTSEARTALQQFEQTQQHVFLTGRAGTGKSTLLRHFRSTTRKRLVVLAPTGVAAVNIQGQTIHSFFGFGPGITPEKARRRVSAKKQLYRRLQAVVIDEISMVRADLLDCIDQFLRLNGPRSGEPFGGVQIIFIGDLYQLPPVVRAEEEDLFSTHYISPFFFDAHVFQQATCHVIQLSHVYRQCDAAFIALLDAVRTDTLKPQQVATLNERYLADLSGIDRQQYVGLVTTNAMADRINAHHLDQIQHPAHRFKGTVNGTFNRPQLPTDETLALKTGARIMMLNNDPRGKWVNGTLGNVEGITDDDDSVSIRVALESGYKGKILPYTWESIRYDYNPRTQRIESEVVGSFTQYPVRLAWGTTIHKAQGKTFDHVVVDFGRGAFAPGQAYVALSRCRSLAGLVLRRPFRPEFVMIDPRVTAFLKDATGPEHKEREDEIPNASRAPLTRGA
jgi:ATP-dependent exoDNAse (exonuclease V) alpha subunit